MIVCKQCGHHNEDNDTFCGSCGKFLEWTGERVAVAEPEAAPAPVAAPAPEPVRHGLIDRVKQAVGIDEATPGGQGAAPTAPPAPASPAAASAPAPASPYRSVPVSSAYATAAAPEPVLAGVSTPAAAPTPAASPAPASDEPLSRRPTSVAPAVVRARPGPRAVEQPARRHPGDLICGQCGEGNDPSRHFCRRCGTELAEAVAVPMPWYRRVLNRIFGGRTREAGWRPARVGTPNVTGMFMRIVRLALLGLVIVFALAFLLIPSFHSLVVSKVTAAVTTVRKAVHPNFDPVHPVSAKASSSIPGHPEMLAIDTFTNTYWAAAPADRQAVLTLSFSSPVDLAEIGFTSGAAGTGPQDQFTAQPRPHQVHLVFSNGTTADLTLTDTNVAKFSPIDAKQVTSVEVHIQSVWNSAGPSPSSVAIAEVEFRVKN